MFLAVPTQCRNENSSWVSSLEDPLDVLVVHEASTYPGALLPCRPLGVVELDQDDQDGKRERNDRVIVIPSWHDRLGELERASELPSALREKIERFFLSH